jgi:hypothetical protein
MGQREEDRHMPNLHRIHVGGTLQPSGPRGSGGVAAGITVLISRRARNGLIGLYNWLSWE